jgi:alpha-beta hydrolase superfamily lysophospholipase
LHGFGDHSGRYQRVAEQCVSARALMCAPDLAGHGRSPGERAVVDDASRLVADVEAVRLALAEEHPGIPIVLIGHGMGGMIAARYAQLHQENLSAVVLSAPVLGTWHYLDLLECDQIPETPMDPHALSRDPEIGREYVADPLVWHGSFPRATLAAIERCLHEINEGSTLRLPTLWLHGEDDEVVPEADTRTGIDRLRGREFHEHIYAGAHHDLFHETNASKVISDLLNFVGRELNT